MKNARIVVLMFVAAFAAMSAASAQEAAATSNSPGLSMYEPAAVSGPAEKPSAVESGAKKLGSFFGKIVKTPVRVAQALAGGVKEGFSQPSQPSLNQGASASKQNGSQPSTYVEPTQASASRTPQEMRTRMMQMFARAKGQPLAPVEDRSVSASASSSMSTSSTQLQTWEAKGIETVPVAQNQLY